MSPTQWIQFTRLSILGSAHWISNNYHTESLHRCAGKEDNGRKWWNREEEELLSRHVEEEVE